MTKEQVRHLLNTHGEDKLLFILMNNGKRFTITEDERTSGKYVFDDNLGLITYKERFNGIDIIHSSPYDFVESLIFKDGAQANFVNRTDGPGIQTDDNGKPIIVPAHKW